MKNRIEHLREGEGNHNEINPGSANDEVADYERGESCSGDGRGQRQPEIGRFIVRRDQREHISRQSEISGMTEAHETRVPDQKIETQGENRHDQDLGAELDIESRADRGKKRERQRGRE